MKEKSLKRTGIKRKKASKKLSCILHLEETTTNLLRLSLPTQKKKMTTDLDSIVAEINGLHTALADATKATQHLQGQLADESQARQALEGQLAGESQARQALESKRRNDQQQIDILERKVRDMGVGGSGTGTGGTNNGKPVVPKVTFGGDPLKWYDFRREFSSFQRFVGWTDTQAKGALETCMRGDAHHAISCLDHLASDPSVTCQTLIEAYEKRFVPEAMTDLASLEFDRAVQGPSESLQSFHGRVRHLYFRAHVRTGGKVPEEADILTHLVKAFTRGIRRKAFRLAIRRVAPGTYNGALQAAQREYSALTGDDLMVDQSLFATNTGVTLRPPAKRPSSEPMDVSALQERDRKQPGPNHRCDICNDPRHWKRDCPKKPAGFGARGGGVVRGGAPRGRGGWNSSRGRGGPSRSTMRYWVQAMNELAECPENQPEDEEEAATLLAMAQEVYEEEEGYQQAGQEYEYSDEDLS